MRWQTPPLILTHSLRKAVLMGMILIFARDTDWR